MQAHQVLYELSLSHSLSLSTHTHTHVRKQLADAALEEHVSHSSNIRAVTLKGSLQETLRHQKSFYKKSKMSPAVSVQHAGTVECATSLRACVACVLEQALTFTRPTGRVQWEGDEKCDDGNTQENDGCDQTCKVESSWLCVGPRDSKFIGIPRKSYMERDSCIRIGSQWIPYGQAEWPGGPRFGSGSVVFKGALWLLGGSGSAYTRQFSTTLSESSNGDLCVAPEPEDSCANGPTDAAGKPLHAFHRIDHLKQSQKPFRNFQYGMCCSDSEW